MLYRDLYDHPLYLMTGCESRIDKDGLITETITVVHRPDGTFTNIQNGENYTMNKDGKLEPVVNASGSYLSGIVRPIKQDATFVKASLNTSIDTPKTCDCGGNIEDYEGNQVCVSCDRFYGMTK